jgi:uncharacterized protein YecE (DUF72 family)
MRIVYKRAMQFFVGTSGYSYKEWKGTFYPEKFPDKKMLKYYGQHFSAVEINNTHYRFPTTTTLETWASQVPESFRFVLKAHKTITHIRRLVGAEQQVDDFIEVASLLGQRQAPLLFQLPPNLKKDLSRLEAFLQHVGGRTRVTLQLLHESWFDDDVFRLLEEHSAALCVADGEDKPSSKLLRTADWCYLRLRGETYTDDALSEWIKQIRALELKEAYVFFKHEDAGAGPKLAERFLQLANA